MFLIDGDYYEGFFKLGKYHGQGKISDKDDL